ncbi:MAG: hypothetical protein WCJ69_18195, partial [Betaproteobacteria bacterium]
MSDSGFQVEALIRLFDREIWKVGPDGSPCRLLRIIRDSRKGQNELSAVLGERVRRAVEVLVRCHGPALSVLADPSTPGGPVDGRDIYAAAVRMVMRLVVVLFAEGRRLLPIDSSRLYYDAYSLAGLRDQLRALHARSPSRLATGRSAWPRLLSLFTLVRDGCVHPDLAVPKYGGALFSSGEANSGMARTLAVFESACYESAFDGLVTDAEVHDILDLLSYSEITIRQGSGSMRTRVPVDFSDLRSEYIGILYEGLLDYELRRAGPTDPIVFLAVGDEPALPLDRLEAMDDAAIKGLVEKFKVKNSKQADEEAGEDAEDDDEGEADEPDEASEVATDVAEPEQAEAPAATADDPTQAARIRAAQWARKAVIAGGMVKKPRSQKGKDAAAQYERDVEAAGRRLIRAIILPNQWYLVRWGGTRKGSGTFYTRPQLSVPTVQRTLRPLAYIAPDDQPDAPPAACTPRKPEEILAIKVCDPAVGSGSFPVAALRFLTEALQRSLQHHGRLHERENKTIIALAEGHESKGRLDEDLLPCRPSDAEFAPRL